MKLKLWIRVGPQEGMLGPMNTEALSREVERPYPGVPPVGADVELDDDDEGWTEQVKRVSFYGDTVHLELGHEGYALRLSDEELQSLRGYGFS